MTDKLKGLLFTGFTIALACGALLNCARIVDFTPLSRSDHLRFMISLIGAAVLWGVALWAAAKDWKRH